MTGADFAVGVPIERLASSVVGNSPPHPNAFHTSSDSNTSSSPTPPPRLPKKTKDPAPPFENDMNHRLSMTHSPTCAMIGPKGAGSYGAVYEACHTASGVRCAVKVIQYQTTSTQTIRHTRQLVRELMLLRCLGEHPNVVPVWQATLVDKQSSPSPARAVHMIMPRYDYDLHDVATQNQAFCQDCIGPLVHQMLCGLAHMHACGVIHGDLKPSNVLVDTQLRAALCDFSLSRWADASALACSPKSGGSDEPSSPWSQSTEDTPVATMPYRAPEALLNNDTITTAVDIWALGCIVAELWMVAPVCAERCPRPRHMARAFHGSERIDVLTAIWHSVPLARNPEHDFAWVECARSRATMVQWLQKRLGSADARARRTTTPVYQRSRWEDRMPPLWCDLVREMLVFNPNQRASATQLLEHPVFAEYAAARMIQRPRPPQTCRAELVDALARLRVCASDKLAHALRHAVRAIPSCDIKQRHIEWVHAELPEDYGHVGLARGGWLSWLSSCVVQ